MAAPSPTFDGPAIVVLFYPDDTQITFRRVTQFDELADGTLVISHDETISKVRPSYLLYQIKPDTGEEDDE